MSEAVGAAIISHAPASASRVKVDRLGLLMSAGLVISLGALPFVAFKPNRLLSGKGVSFHGALEPWILTVTMAFVVVAVVSLCLSRRPFLRAIAATFGLLALVLALGTVPATLIPASNALARVSPAAGFWLALFALAVLITDALARMHLLPLQRILALCVALMLIFGVLISGAWDGLSVMKEFAVNTDTFWNEARRHVALAFGSLAAALIAGLPLGVACQRLPALRATVLPVLNIVQTIPSIAMFGILMGPLALLATNWPVVTVIGIRGIGAAPAAIALFLYALLPVVVNTVVGLESAPSGVIDAARGMGMTGRQRLFQIEFPLALPVLLSGVRIVLVQNIGLATIAALIGGGGFGAYVFKGMGQAAIDLVLVGAAPTVLMAFTAAILLDAVIDLMRGKTA